MQANEVKQVFMLIQKQYKDIMSMVQMDELNQQVDDLDQQTYDQDFWQTPDTANAVIKQLKNLKNKQEQLQSYIALYEELEVLNEFIHDGEDMFDEFIDQHNRFETTTKALQIELLFSDDNDHLDSIIEIHPGAGGTESQDWANMLYRMYTRYAEQNDFQFELLNYLPGDEAGIKSVTFAVRGTNSYGYLQAENGVHRLVRISPFDSAGRRHTSFASVQVIPEIDDNIDVDIQDKDLKIDTYRSSGAGGQSVNTTDSAVRVTHIPTNTVVTVQNERSQIKNRETAMNILKGKLYVLELEKKRAEISSYRTSDANSFGSQIRSYVMHPYSMVKDHRTNHETGNVQKVMDGDITPFIYAFLKQKAKGA